MSAQGLASWHQFVLLRDGIPAASDAQRRILTDLAPLPVWATAQDRVELSLQERAESVLNASFWGECEEVHARFAGGDEMVPAMAILSDLSPVVAVMLDDRVHVAVMLSADGLRRRGSFNVVCTLAHNLAAAGFSRLVDDASGAAGPLSDGVLAARFGVSEGRRTGREVWLEVKTGAAIGSAVGTVLGLSLVIRYRPPLLASIAAVAGGAALTALFGMWTAWWHEQLERATHMRRFRASLLPGHQPGEANDFAADWSWSGLALAVIFFGGGLWFSVRAGEILAVVVFSIAASIVFGYGLALQAAHVEVDGTGLTGLTVRGRRRIAFRDIDWISASQDPEPRLVHAVDVGSIWLPRPVDDGEHLFERVWSAALTANAERIDAVPRDDVERQAVLVGYVRRAVSAARGNGRGGVARHRAWRPLWLVLMRHHPLREQFRWQRHLLLRGRVVLAHLVTGANSLRWTGPASEASDAPALVVFSTSMLWRDGVAAAERIRAVVLHLQTVQRAEADGVPLPEPLPEDKETFAKGLRRNAGNPWLLPVPAALGGGRGVFCTSVILVRRHLPLGSLRSTWLPLLIDPEATRFAMVVPLALWPPAVRRVWKAGPLPPPEPGPAKPADSAAAATGAAAPVTPVPGGGS